MSATPARITAADTYDIRLPTSRELDGSDAKNLPRPGPEKGVMHMAVGAVANAVWDFAVKRAGAPLRRLLAGAHPEWLVAQTIRRTRALAEWDPYWIEAPTSSDGVLGRAAVREDVAPVRVATDLASPLSGATTGTSLAVDGGMRGPRPRQEAR